MTRALEVNEPAESFLRGRRLPVFLRLGVALQASGAAGELDFAALAQVPATIPAALEAGAHAHPDREAVVASDGRITYRDLHTRAETMARALAKAGIRKGDHVALCMGNTVLWTVLFYAIQRAGAVCVPINTRLKALEIAYQLKQSDARLLFLADRLLNVDFVALFREFCPQIDTRLPSAAFPALRRIVIAGEIVPAACEALDAFGATGAAHDLPPPPDAEDVALIQYTSGTTSFPKGAMLTHRNMLYNACCVGMRMGLRGEDRYLSARPFFHVAGSTLSIVVSCVRGATLVSMLRFGGDEALRLLAEERCTMTSGNDTMYLMMLNAPTFRRGAYALRGGWAAANPSTMRRIIEEFGARETVTAYGLSEASPNVVMSDHRDDTALRIEGWMRVHPGLEVVIVDPETQTACAPGEPGEIRVRGWCVMKGYYAMPDATAATIRPDGFLLTGDLGVMDAQGRLKFLGRLKDNVRVGGENVAPAEIEDVLNQHPKIRMAQVFALPDPRLIEVPGAYVVAREGATVEVEEILEWMKPRLASFKIPKYMAVIESFDIVGMTASSKVPKRYLIEHATKHFNLAKAE